MTIYFNHVHIHYFESLNYIKENQDKFSIIFLFFFVIWIIINNTLASKSNQFIFNEMMDVNVF